MLMLMLCSFGFQKGLENCLHQMLLCINMPNRVVSCRFDFFNWQLKFILHIWQAQAMFQLSSEW